MRFFHAIILVLLLMTNSVMAKNNAWIGVMVEDSLVAVPQQEEPAGVLVRELVGGSPAAEIGILKNDVIKKINGAEIKDSNDFATALSGFVAGDKVSVLLLREGLDVILDVQIGSLTAAYEHVLTWLGVELSFKPDIFRVQVAKVLPGSKAAAANIKSGDFIAGFDRLAFDDELSFRRVVANVQLDKRLYILVLRKSNKPQQVELVEAIFNSDKEDELLVEAAKKNEEKSHF